MDGKPKCVVCLKVLSAESMKKNKLKRHLKTNHPNCLDKPVEFFERKFHPSPFYSIQLDESTDIAGLPQLSLFIRYINNGAVSEDLLFCKALKLHTKGEDIFQCLNDFFTEHSIPWEKCAGICTDGAAACRPTGFKSGVVKRIKGKAPDAEWTHCFLHREALCAKKMSQELHEVLNSVVKCVNLIKARPLNQRIFSCLCSDMDADYKALLLHSEVRWLSRGRVLKRVCDLRDEIVIFLRQQHFTEIAEKFSREDFNAKTAYLAYIFDSLNCLNLPMQGVGFTVIDHAAKVAAYYRKLIPWKSYAARNQYDMFAELTKYICGKEIDIKQTIIGHLN